MPKYLPASALQECPVFPLPEEPTKPSYTSRYGYDENDPFAGNRLAINGGDEKFAIKKTVDTGRGEPTREALKPRNLNTIASHKAIDDATGTVHNPLMKAGARSSSANPSVKHTATYESSTTPKNTVTSVTRSSSTLSGRTTRSQTPTNTLNVPALSTANERKVSQKFDIFTDDKDTKQKRDKSIELRRESSGSRRLSGEHRDSSRDRSGRRNSIGNEDENPTAVRSLSHIAQRKPSSKRVQDSADEIIDQMQMELENIAINTKEEVKEVAEAWMQQDIYPMDVEQPPLTTNTTDRHLDRFATNQKVGSTDVGEEPDHEAMCISTPRDQIMKEYNKKQLGTLETMHEMLNNSFSILEQQNMPKSVEVEQNANPSSNLVANVWVVRYVDYTSKYGLGFLFNTGSAGVYFNDSTKIVLSPDGTVFQYIERRRKDSSNGSEHSSQTHFISSYPSELQKKVTLLKHFRNYLIDQQKSGTQQADGFDHNDLNCKPGLLQDHASAGATTAVKFGSSSAVTENGEEDLPFLKKWVRTKHAILFRISNKTVQVVFYDRR